MWCISKTNITFVPFKYRQRCLKMTFDVGKCGSYVIFKLGEYIFEFVWNTFFFKILQFLDSVCALACSKVFNLSKLFLIHINNCICMISRRFERQVKQKFHSSMCKVEKCFIINPAFFLQYFKNVASKYFYLKIRVPLSVVNYNKLKFQLNFNSI